MALLQMATGLAHQEEARTARAFYHALVAHEQIEPQTRRRLGLQYLAEVYADR